MTVRLFENESENSVQPLLDLAPQNAPVITGSSPVMTIISV
jgi:hypothetical protein